MTQYYSSPPPVSSSGIVAPAKTSVLAVVSLVLGILGFVSAGVLGLIGVILGIFAIVGIKKSAGQLKGSGLAIAGISVGACSVVMSCLFIGLLWSASGVARETARSVKAMSAIQQLSFALHSYSANHDGQLPPIDDWQAALNGTVANQASILGTWPDRDNEGRAFAMNAKLDGVHLSDWKSSRRLAVLFFEVAPNSPMAGGPDLFPQRPRAGSRGFLVSFTDGHTEFVPPEKISGLPWEP